MLKAEIKQRAAELREVAEAERPHTLPCHFPKLRPLRRPRQVAKDMLWRLQQYGIIRKRGVMPRRVKYAEWEEFEEAVPPKHRDMSRGLPIDQAHQAAVLRGLMSPESTLSEFLDRYRGEVSERRSFLREAEIELAAEYQEREAREIEEKRRKRNRLKRCRDCGSKSKRMRWFLGADHHGLCPKCYTRKRNQAAVRRGLPEFHVVRLPGAGERHEPMPF